MVERSWYFENTFLFIDISISIALGMSFFTLGNAEINFLDQKLSSKLFTTA